MLGHFASQITIFRTLVKYTFIEAFYNKLILMTLGIVVLVFFSSHFIGLLAITEHQQVILALQGSFLRITLVFLIALFTIGGVQREIHDKNLELVFSTSASRACYLVSKLLAYMLISTIPILLSCLVLLWHAQWINVMMWGTSLFFEIAIVIALCLLMVFTFKSTPSALFFVFIFYLASRVIQSVQLMANNPILDYQSTGQSINQFFINSLAFLLPPLNDFAKTEWLVYEIPNVGDLNKLFIQSIVYIIFLNAIALFDLQRKNI